VRPGRAADHSPFSSAEVLRRVELYLYPPLGHNRACNGVTLPLPNIPTQCTHAMYPRNVPTQYTPAMYPRNIPAQCTHAMYPRNIPTQYTHAMYPCKVHTIPSLFMIMQKLMLFHRILLVYLPLLI